MRDEPIERSDKHRAEPESGERAPHSTDLEGRDEQRPARCCDHDAGRQSHHSIHDCAVHTPNDQYRKGAKQRQKPSGEAAEGSLLNDGKRTKPVQLAEVWLRRGVAVRLSLGTPKPSHDQRQGGWSGLVRHVYPRKTVTYFCPLAMHVRR